MAGTQYGRAARDRMLLAQGGVVVASADRVWIVGVRAFAWRTPAPCVVGVSRSASSERVVAGCPLCARVSGVLLCYYWEAHLGLLSIPRRRRLET